MAGLRGELLVLNSMAEIGQFDSSRSYQLRSLSGGDVAFLVYAQVPKWRTVTLPPEITDFASLERGLPALANAAGLNPDEPFPFRLSGRAIALRWFVVGGVGNGEPNALNSFMRARTLGGLDDAEIDGLGFFSTRHRGVFTNPASNMHVHFSTPARAGVGAFIGHLDDDVRLAPGALLHLPAADWQATSLQVNERHRSAVHPSR
jgi:acetolactate decarboxylase